MGDHAKLTDTERGFLLTVNQAAFANPFSDSRAELDAALAGSTVSGKPEGTLDAALVAIQILIEKLDGTGHRRLGDFTSEERSLLKGAYLFLAFHRHINEMDSLIQTQMATPEENCAVPFASELLAALSARGFTHHEAVRYLALFFQLRRAFYFIQCSLVGGCPCMRELRYRLWNNVFTHDIQLYDRLLWDRMEDFSTLLLGETGTGKGASATAIGRSGFIPFDDRGNRFAENFMTAFTAVNLSQFPETLIESELFGHRKGAFTGAVETHQGVFDRCSAHGAIFLDEIGDCSVPVQIKLLKVLQDRTFCPVGSHAPRRFRGRVIAASNKALDRRGPSAPLREDFYYRLCSDIITVPSLRQRLAEDASELRQLLDAIMSKLIPGDSAAVDRVHATLTSDIGRDYPWPGNVRELEQAVRRVLLTNHYHAQAANDRRNLVERLKSGVEAGTYAADALLDDYCKLLFKRSGTYESVARVVGLDRRTVKKHVLRASL